MAYAMPAAGHQAAGYQVGARRSSASASADWSTQQSLCLPPQYRPEDFDGKAQVLDVNSVSGVSDAVEKLNQGKIHCADPFCIVFSVRARNYFVIWRSGTDQKDIWRKLALQTHYERPSLVRKPSEMEVTCVEVTIVDVSLARVFGQFQSTQDLFVELYRIKENGEQNLLGRTDQRKGVTLTATWNEPFRVRKSGEKTQLKIAVCAAKALFSVHLKNTICGEIVLDDFWKLADGSLSQSTFGVTQQSHNLTKKGEKTGELRIKLQLKDSRLSTTELMSTPVSPADGAPRKTFHGGDVASPANATAASPTGAGTPAEGQYRRATTGYATDASPVAPGAERKPARYGTQAPGSQDAAAAAAVAEAAAAAEEEAAIIQSDSPIDPRMQKLLNRPEDLKEKVRAIFRGVAPKGSLQQHEMPILADALAKELRTSPDVFGNLTVLFLRYDFDCNNSIDEKEAIMMMQSCIFKFRDAVCPQFGSVQLGEGIHHMKVQEKYDLGKELGRGGQAIVHLATQRDTKREVVLKMYTKNNPDMPVEDITNEFKLLIKLKHPKIARYYDIFQDYSNFYIVSEPYFGGDLTKLVSTAHSAGVSVTESWLARISLQIAQGVSFLHTQHVMHCDLKEANVMVSGVENYDHPQIVVIDFGLANHLSSDSSGGGSPGYMPPEVWDTGMWTPRGDVFSLGCVVFALCYGQSPFLEGCRTIDDVRDMTLTSEPTLDFGSKNMRTIVESMLQKSLHDRPSMKQIVDCDWFTEQLASEGLNGIPDSALKRFAGKAKQTDLRRALLADIASRENLAQLHRLNNLFVELDQDNDGILTQTEMREALSKHGWSSGDVSNLLSCLVAQGDEIHYEDFMVNLMTSTAVEESALMERIFAEADTNGTGYLVNEDVAGLLKRPQVAKVLGKRSVDEVMAEMDLDNDGKVTLEEFKQAMHGVPREQRPACGSNQYTIKNAVFAKSMAKRLPMYTVGQDIEYYSRTYSTWLPGKITASDPSSGAVQVDNKPGWWLKGADLKNVRPKGAPAGYGGPGSFSGPTSF